MIHTISINVCMTITKPVTGVEWTLHPPLLICVVTFWVVCSPLIRNRKSLLAVEPINNGVVTFLLNKYDQIILCAGPSLLAGEPINNGVVTFLLNKYFYITTTEKFNNSLIVLWEKCFKSCEKVSDNGARTWLSYKCDPICWPDLKLIWEPINNGWSLSYWILCAGPSLKTGSHYCRRTH